MTKKIKATPPEPPFGLDMPFDEALKRFIATDPKEVEASANGPKKKKPGGKKPPGETVDDPLRVRKRKYGS